MLKMLICITMVIVSIVGQSYGFYCKDGQTNYTTTYFTVEYEEAYTTRTKSVSYYTCGWWGIRCKTKFRTTREYITKIVTVQKPYEVVKCCPGFVNGSNGCTPGCKEGLYGTNCTQNCTWCRSHCEMDSGDCICEPGYTGDNCTQECSTNLYGVNCEHKCRCKNNSTCNATDGSCNCTSPGWEGALCDQECTNNTYGLFCNETCMCNENQTCDHVNGSCICKSGWHGENCSKECDAMTFGVDCLKNCTCDRNNTQTCDRETGYCHCKPGYKNRDCDSVCKMGTFGENCSRNCSDNCTYTDYCDHINGSCICLGMRGPNCSQECTAGTFGPNCIWLCNCNNSLNESCNNTSGQCVCDSGWTGRTCDKECTNNSYGLFCNETCMCNENQTCDHVNGSCICKSGWHGENCSKECTNNTYGLFCNETCMCNENQTCDHVNGSCICKSGWHGENCSKECEPGTYGPSCSLYCDCTNSKDKSCHNVTGQCDCKPGWIGRTCDNETDSSISDIEYLSDNSQGFFEDNMLYLIIGLIALFILTTLTITVVCIRRRHVCSSMFKSGAKGASIITNSQENPGYDASLKDAIQISNMSSIATPNNYEEADIELKGDNLANNDSHIVSNGTCSDKSAENRGSALTNRETAQDLEEDEYSVPDKHTHTHNGDQSNDDRNSQEVYNCTQDDAKTDHTPNEYNTFSDVKKIQKEAGKQKNESDSEEDYDVISHSGRTDSKKKNLKDHEHENYSSFEQVRKLSLKESANEEEDTYNALNEHLHVHKSAHINISQYHHISLKDKTVDGEEFDQTKPAVRITSQRQSSTSHRLSKQKSFPEKDVITEDSEEEQEDVNTETKLKVNDIIEDDMTEVIYDECGVDDEDNAPNIEEVKKVADVPVSNNANIDEVVYEECDENVNEQSNAVLYEDVDNVSQKSDSSEEVEDEEDEGKDKHEHGPDHQQQMPLIKRTKERRREDYEEFNL